MISRVFIDTNILIYFWDHHHQKKQKISQEGISSLKQGCAGVISTQVMQEFYVIAVQKLKLDPVEVKSYLRLLENFEVVLIDPDLIGKAVDCSIVNKINFWDGLIICAAESANCEEIWTEDLSHNQIINGVKINNIYQGKI